MKNWRGVIRVMEVEGDNDAGPQGAEDPGM